MTTNLAQTEPLADSWTRKPLKDLGRWVGGGTPSKSKPQYWENGTVPWVSPKDMKKERITDSEDHITEVAVSESTTNLVPAGSILVVTRSGILRHTLPVAVAGVPVTVNQDLKALTPKSDILPEYVAWGLRAFSQDILHTCSKQGTTVNSIETQRLLDYEIPLAPPEQQKAIVAEIEKQFSRLDEAVGNLKRVKANLKRYKAAVLKAAVEGKLTEDWRKAHPDLEPASELLKCILAERRAKWKGKGKYKEPSDPDTPKIPSLPTGWTVTSVSQLLTEPLCNGISVKGRDTPPGIRALRLSAMSDTGFDYSDVRYLPLSQDDVEDLWIEEGDFFISRGNGSLHLVGRGTSAQKPHQPTIFPDTMIRLRLAKEIRRSGWLHTIWPSRMLRSQIERKVKTTAGIYKIAQPEVEQITIPLPPSFEQEQIVADVQRRFSVIEELEAQVAADLQRAERFRQSILQRAFAGKLKSDRYSNVSRHLEARAI